MGGRGARLVPKQVGMYGSVRARASRAATALRHQLARALAGAAASRPRYRLLSEPTLQDLLATLLSLGAVISILAVVALLSWDIIRQTITIEPIVVPKTYAEERGLTPEVLSNRLQDAVYAWLSRKEPPNTAWPPFFHAISFGKHDIDITAIPGPRVSFVPQSDLPAIVVPGIGSSLDKVAVELQDLLGIDRRKTVTGELTRDDGVTKLVLRINHRVVFQEQVWEAPPMVASPITGPQSDIAPPAGPPTSASPKSMPAPPPPVKSVTTNLEKQPRYIPLARDTYEQVTSIAHPGQSAPDLATLLDDAALAILAVTEPKIGAAQHNNRGNARHRDRWLFGALADYEAAVALSSDDPVMHYNLAYDLLELGRMPQALSEYQAAIRLDPHNDDARVGAAYVLVSMRRFDESEQELAAVLTTSPHDVAAKAGLGTLREAQGRLDEADAAFGAALIIQPNDPISRLGLGRIRMEQNRLDEAANVLRSLIADDAQLPLAHLSLGSVLLMQDKVGEAEAEIQSGLRQDWNSSDGHALQGSVLQRQHDLIGAEAEFRLAMSLNRNSAVAHAGLGGVLINQHKLPEALAEFDAATVIDPSYSIGLLGKATVFWRQRRVEEASAALHAALAINSHDVSAHNRLGDILEDQYRYTDAEAEYRLALALDQDNADAQVGLAQILEDQYRFNDAAALLSARLVNSPASSVLRLEMGYVLHDQYRLNEAEAAFRDLLSVDLDNSAARLGLARVLADEGKSSAKIELTELLRRDPENVDGREQLGYVLLGEKRYDAATSEFQRLLIDSEPATAATGHVGLGEVWRNRHDRRRAAIEYRAAVELRPDDSRAWRKLGDVLPEMERAAAYQQALAIDERNPAAHTGLGKLLQSRGQLEQAAAHYRTALAAEPHYVAAHAGLAAVLIALHRPADAKAERRAADESSQYTRVLQQRF